MTLRVMKLYFSQKHFIRQMARPPKYPFPFLRNTNSLGAKMLLQKFLLKKASHNNREVKK